jgi:hypothetical protein
VAIDGHPRRIAIQHLQPFGNIGHANSGTSRTGCSCPFAGSHSHAIILDLNYQSGVRQAASQVNASTLDFGRKSVLD